MKHLLVCCAAAAAIVGLSAKADAQIAATGNWTGFYVGGNLGYGWGRSNANVSGIPNFAPTAPLTNPTFAAQNPSGAFTLDGVVGGLQIGWNVQYANWVFGIETDFQAANRGDSRVLDPSGFNVPTGGGNVILGSLGGSLETELSWFGTLRGRIGQAWNNVLIYGTGGLAYGRVKVSGVETISGTYFGGGIPVPGGCFAGCGYSSAATFYDSQTKLGWTLGAGVEASLWSSNWTWKVEYLYVDLGSMGGIVPYGGSIRNPGGAIAPIASTVSYDSSFTDHVIRVGLNYRM